MINKNGLAYDPRVYLFSMVASITMAQIVYHEVSLLLLFTVSLVWVAVALKGENLLSYVVGYFIIWGLTRISLYFVSLDSMNSFAILIGVLCRMGRIAFPPFILAIILSKQPTGSLLGALYAMNIPKAIGIGITTMLRFFPTLSEEYRHIRNAGKFRGIGVGFWHTLAHFPKVLSNVYIPLLIRITKISEELAASVTVRGVRFRNEVVSFRGVKFTIKDGIALAATIVTMMLIFVADKWLMEVM